MNEKEKRKYDFWTVDMFIPLVYNEHIWYIWGKKKKTKTKRKRKQWMMMLCRRALWEHSDGVISEVELGERRQSVHWRRRDEVVAAQHETTQRWQHKHRRIAEDVLRGDGMSWMHSSGSLHLLCVQVCSLLFSSFSLFFILSRYFVHLLTLFSSFSFFSHYLTLFSLFLTPLQSPLRTHLSEMECDECGKWKLWNGFQFVPIESESL